MLSSTHPPRGPKAIKIDPEHILAAAERVFAKEGLRGASIRVIAREAGCDPALLYYHFASKEAIFTEMLDRTFPSLIREVERLSDPYDQRHTAARFWDVLGAVRRHVGRNAGFRAAVRGEMTQGAEGIKDAIAARIRPFFEAVSSLFRQGVQRGHIRPDFPEALGVFFFVRLYIEILDLVPVMAGRIAHMPADQALPLAERAWFGLYWRGISTRPGEPLPFLDAIEEFRP